MSALDDLLAEVGRPLISRPRPSAKPHECRQLTSGGGSTGRWLDDVTPKRGWSFERIIRPREAYDLVGDDPISCPGEDERGNLIFICQMCQKERLLYVHVVSHPDHDDLLVGCICDGHMTGDPFAARQHHADEKALRGSVQTAAATFDQRRDDPKYCAETPKGFRIKAGGGWTVQIFRGQFDGWSAGVFKNGNAPVFLGRYVEDADEAVNLGRTLFLQIVECSKRTKGLAQLGPRNTKGPAGTEPFKAALQGQKAVSEYAQCNAPNGSGQC